MTVRELDLPAGLEGAEPERLWENFNLLRQIPRESGNEAETMAFLGEWADENGFEWKRDKVGNICIKVPASEGCEGAETVCLQGHADMVCVSKDKSDFDFKNDAIQMRRDSEDWDWLTSEGNETSVGFDNGVGIAAAMTIATDPDVKKRPPLELLVTVEEETGLVGAFGIDPEALGMESTKFVNLDTEELGSLYVKTAGGQDLKGTLPIDRVEDDRPGRYLELSISGMNGGHSGVDIHENVGNAILEMERLLGDITSAVGDEVSLVSLDGGDKSNGIPSEAKAVIFVPDELYDIEIFTTVLSCQTRLNLDLKHKEMIKVNTRDLDMEEGLPAYIGSGIKHRILDVLGDLGEMNGVIKMDEDVEGLVETSMNTAIIETGEDVVELTLSLRSLINSELDKQTARASGILGNHGFKVEASGRYPGWNADPNSELVQAAADAFVEVAGDRAKVKGIHAGLECGLIVNALEEKVGQTVQAVSFGPTIDNPHSVNERVDIDSVYVFYEQLASLLGTLAMKKA